MKLWLVGLVGALAAQVEQVQVSGGAELFVDDEPGSPAKEAAGTSAGTSATIREDVDASDKALLSGGVAAIRKIARPKDEAEEPNARLREQLEPGKEPLSFALKEKRRPWSEEGAVHDEHEPPVVEAEAVVETREAREAVEKPQEKEPSSDSMVRNGNRSSRSDGPKGTRSRWGSMLETRLGAGAESEAGDQAASGAQAQAGMGLPCLGRAGGAICGCLAAVALFNYCGKLCCGEKSCWYTWSCCKRARLALHLDEVPALSLQVTVHRARDMGLGSAIFIAVLPRRHKSGRQKPKLSKGSSAITASTTDLKWEQHLTVAVEQGCDTLQICAFKKARIGKGTLLGWDTLRITDLLDKNMEPLTRKWIHLSNDEGSPVGSVNVTIPVPTLADAGTSGKKKSREGGGTTKSGPEVDAGVPDTAGMTESETLEAYAKNLTGPLNQANKLGEYNLRYFRIEQKRDVWIWAWYKERNPAPGSKPLGRIPLLSISTIYEVPHSISEFIVRYRDATDRTIDMMLQRHERPREHWVKTLHSMLVLLRDKRKRRKQESRSGLEVPRRTGERGKTSGGESDERRHRGSSGEGWRGSGSARGSGSDDSDARFSSSAQ